jgi:DNA-binding SARP family transcriptional activator
MTHGEHGPFLRTLGHPVLIGPSPGPVAGLRRKDLALLAYLCVEGPRPHSRARLAALLWGESPEKKARHSLTQALGRIEKATRKDAVVKDRESVRSTGTLPCDAVWLLSGDERLDPLLTLYEGPFLEGFEPGAELEEFGVWADGRRAELRNAALRYLERTGTEAESACDWALALRIGERGAEIDPVHEEARRRVMRALLEMGEANRALRYYQEFVDWLAAEVGGEPDPETRALAERIRAIAANPPPPPRVPPPRVPPPPPPPAPPADPPGSGQPAVEAAEDEPPLRPAAKEPAPAAPRGRRAVVESLFVGGWLCAGVLTVVLLRGLVSALFGPLEEQTILPGHGESIRLVQGGPVYLAYAETLWRYPDAATLDRCLGGWRQRIRRVEALPEWPRRVLPSVAAHPWQGGMVPVVTDHPQLPTQHVAVGCVLAPVPDPPTFQAIFGNRDWNRSYGEADSVLRATPRTKEAAPYPVRAAGTLIRDPGGGLKWIVYHGGALTATARLLGTYCRSPKEAVLVSAAEYAYYRAAAALPPADPPCRDAGHPQPCPAVEAATDPEKRLPHAETRRHGENRLASLWLRVSA